MCCCELSNQRRREIRDSRDHQERSNQHLAPIPLELAARCKMREINGSAPNHRQQSSGPEGSIVPGHNPLDCGLGGVLSRFRAGHHHTNRPAARQDLPSDEVTVAGIYAVWLIHHPIPSSWDVSNISR